MFHGTDFGRFLVCCYKAIQKLNGVEKNSVAISLMVNHNLTGLIHKFLQVFISAPRQSRWDRVQGKSDPEVESSTPT